MQDSRGNTSLGPLLTTVASVVGPAALTNFVAPPDGVSFTQAGLTVVVLLLSLLLTGIVTLFILLLNEKQIRIDEWKRQAESVTKVAEQAVDQVAKVRGI